MTHDTAQVSAQGRPGVGSRVAQHDNAVRSSVGRTRRCPQGDRLLPTMMIPASATPRNVYVRNNQNNCNDLSNHGGVWVASRLLVSAVSFADEQDGGLLLSMVPIPLVINFT
ncbi:hypothetical protein J6590_002486 [Homalodisca vitripennis]|nr:hypothetical protein J6590_002486 [Homalodisca vitripennis]